MKGNASSTFQSEQRRLRRIYEDAPTSGAGTWYSLEVACLMFGVSRRRLYNVLCERRDELDPPTYRLGQGARLYRVISERDYALLRPSFRLRIWRRHYR